MQKPRSSKLRQRRRWGRFTSESSGFPPRDLSIRAPRSRERSGRWERIRWTSESSWSEWSDRERWWHVLRSLKSSGSYSCASWWCRRESGRFWLCGRLLLLLILPARRLFESKRLSVGERDLWYLGGISGEFEWGDLGRGLYRPCALRWERSSWDFSDEIWPPALEEVRATENISSTKSAVLSPRSSSNCSIQKALSSLSGLSFVTRTTIYLYKGVRSVIDLNEKESNR